METLTLPKPGSTRKVHKDETAPAPPPPGVGDNGPDPDTVLLFAGKIRKEMLNARAAAKRLTAAKRMAKNAGLFMKELMEAIANQELDPDTVAQTFARRKFYNEVLNTPVGTQLSLFEVKPRSAIPTASERADAAFKTGYLHGIQGDWPDTQAYGTDHENHQDYLRGHAAGQKVLLDRIQPIDEQLAEVERKARGEKPVDETAGDGKDA